MSDAQLRQLPPPAYPGPSRYPVPAWRPAPTSTWSSPAAPRDQRPVVVGLATTLAVTASLLWISGLSLGWLVAAAASGELYRSGETGLVFHTLRSFSDRMLDGLAIPLYVFPVASLVTGFLLLRRRGWTRVLHTVVGLLALSWSAWWLQHSLLQWGGIALYVGIAVAVLWTPAANRWYARPPAG